MAVKSFTRGSSTYTCRCCGRTTRASRDMSEGDTQLCAPCYELAGWENTFNDYGAEEVNIENVTFEFEDLGKKGVSDEKLAKLFPDLWELVMGDEPDALMITPRGDLVRESETNVKYEYPAGMSSADKKKFRAAARKAAKKS